MYLAIIFVIILTFILYNVRRCMINSELLNKMYVPVDKNDLMKYNIEHVKIKHEGETLSCYLKKNTDKYLLFFGGNETYASQELELINNLSKNYSVIMMDYRGYGESTGDSDYNNIVTDGIAVFHYLTNEMKVSSNNIIIGGLSLGGAVACQITHDLIKYENIGGLILISTFSSLGDMANLLIRQKYHNNNFESIINMITYDVLNTNNNLKYIDNKCKILIVHNGKDTLIPITQAMRNYNAISNTNKFHIVKTGNHCDFPDIDLLKL